MSRSSPLPGGSSRSTTATPPSTDRTAFTSARYLLHENGAIRKVERDAVRHALRLPEPAYGRDDDDGALRRRPRHRRVGGPPRVRADRALGAPRVARRLPPEPDPDAGGHGGAHDERPLHDRGADRAVPRPAAPGRGPDHRRPLERRP